MSRLLFLILAFLCWTVAASAQQMPKLAGPIDVAARRLAVGKPSGLYACLEIPQPERDIQAMVYFKDKANSLIDPDQFARNKNAVRGVEDFARGVQGIAEAYLRSAPADGSIAQCALDWLAAWAESDAMLGEMSSRQSLYERQWMIVGLGIPYLIIRDEPTLSPRKKALVRDWFVKLLAALRDPPTPRDLSDSLRIRDSRNNIQNWAGAATMVAAVVLNDRPAFDAAVESYKRGIDEVAPDGSLPMELARLSRAQHYHIFALQPLVLMAEIGMRNGVDLYSYREGAIHRLADLVIRTLDDPKWFENRASAPQEWIGKPSGALFAWAEPYYARFRDRRLEPYLNKYRPCRYLPFGGDATLAYGVAPQTLSLRP